MFSFYFLGCKWNKNTIKHNKLHNKNAEKKILISEVSLHFGQVNFFGVILKSKQNRCHQLRQASHETHLISSSLQLSMLQSSALHLSSSSSSSSSNSFSGSSSYRVSSSTTIFLLKKFTRVFFSVLLFFTSLFSLSLLSSALGFRFFLWRVLFLWANSLWQVVKDWPQLLWRQMWSLASGWLWFVFL